MLFGLILIVHILVAFFLMGVILLQGGRGGLGDALGGAAAQSLFGGGVNTVMTKITAVSAAVFMVTCLVLAKLSTERGRSVIDQSLPIAVPAAPEALPQELPAALPVAPQQTEPVDAAAFPSPDAPVPSASTNETSTPP